MNVFSKRMLVSYYSCMTWLTAALFALLMMASAVAKAESFPGSFANLAEKLLPAVVNISTTQVIKGRSGPTMPQLPPGSPFEEFFREFMDRNQQQGEPRRQRNATSLGSGFVVNIGKNGDADVINAFSLPKKPDPHANKRETYPWEYDHDVIGVGKSIKAAEGSTGNKLTYESVALKRGRDMVFENNKINTEAAGDDDRLADPPKKNPNYA